MDDKPINATDPLTPDTLRSSIRYYLKMLDPYVTQYLRDTMEAYLARQETDSQRMLIGHLAVIALVRQVQIQQSEDMLQDILLANMETKGRPS